MTNVNLRQQIACVAAVSFPFTNAREREENCEIFWLTPGVLLRSPAFRSLVRSPCGLKKERNRLLRRLANKIRFRLNICENVTSCFLKVSKRLSSYYVSQQLFKLEFATETKLTALNVLYCAVNI